MNSQYDNQEIYELLIMLLENDLTDSQRERLVQWSRNDPDAVNKYYRFLRSYSLVSREIAGRIEDRNDLSSDTYFNQALYDALAEDEKTAPAIEVAAHKEPQVLIQKVQHQKVVRKISKSTLLTLFTAAAAIILIFVFAYLTPPETGIKVAVLADSLNAAWADNSLALEKGSPVFTSRENLVLQKGYAKLLFENQAQITLEGPAEFQILAENKINLRYGRLYAQVPWEAIGFMVTSQTAKVIDLGTEFGVEVNSQGDTSLHVMKGKTTLVAGEESNKSSIDVIQGIAKKVAAATFMISDIPCDTQLFVRTIDSRNHTIWKGQPILSLADIVGGGNGLGTGNIDIGIDPISGKMSKESWGSRKSANDYHPVPGNPYIDGVFVPNGRTPQIVSSQGHRFDQCPVTCGLSCERIGSSPVRSLDSRIEQNKEITDLLPHSLLVHANMGITFDLQAIRNFLPGVNIIRFQSKFGIRQWAIHPTLSNADFWVLVDGKLRYVKKQVKIDEMNSIDLELSEQDRFLTLIETDGGDPEGRILDGAVLPPTDSDWGVFVDPVLVLK